MSTSKKVTLSSVSVDSNRLDIHLTVDTGEQEEQKLVWVEYNIRSDMTEVHTNDSKGDELKKSFDMGFTSKGAFINQEIFSFITALVKEGYTFIGVR